MTDDWTRRAEREAAAMLDGVGYDRYNVGTTLGRDALLDLLAATWLQGVNYGCHESLAGVEGSVEQMRARL